MKEGSEGGGGVERRSVALCDKVGGFMRQSTEVVIAGGEVVEGWRRQ
jgi:hypothetical protein